MQINVFVVCSSPTRLKADDACTTQCVRATWRVASRHVVGKQLVTKTRVACARPARELCANPNVSCEHVSSIRAIAFFLHCIHNYTQTSTLFIDCNYMRKCALSTRAEVRYTCLRLCINYISFILDFSFDFNLDN